MEFSVDNVRLKFYISLGSILFFFVLRGFILGVLGRKMMYSNLVKKLSLGKLVDFEGRLVALVHAAPCVILTPIGYFLNPGFYVDHYINHASFLFCCVACWDLGYMLYDTIFIIYNHLLEEEKEFKVYMFHHLVSSTTAFICAFLNKFQLGGAVLIMFEVTGFCSNGIFLLPLAGLRDSPIYILNAILLLICWVVFRFVLGVVYLRYVCWLNWEHYYTNSSMVIFLFFELCQGVFAFINFLWFYKLIVGFVHVLQGKKIRVDSDGDSTKKEE